MSVLIGTPLDDTLTGDAGADNTIVGEDSIPAGGTGGNDTLTGGGNGSNTIFGDAQDALLGAGGDDLLTGGSDATNTLIGDAARLAGPRARGGNDRLNGGQNSTNILVGDTKENFENVFRGGGDDIITGGASSTNTAAGDALGDINQSDGAGSDVLFGGENGTNNLYGDTAGELFASDGGDDRIVGGSHSTNLLSGDAAVVTGHPFDHSHGGSDVLIGGSFATNRMFGDAVELLFSDGGNDTLTGGSDSVNMMFGDAGGDLAALFARFPPNPFKAGGDDVLTGGERSVNTMFGDAGANLERFTIGGSDQLTGGAASSNVLVGDGGRLVAGSIGGDDTLVGGAGGTNMLFGDAKEALAASTGGDDTLIAGDGATNTLVGDAMVLAGGDITGGDPDSELTASTGGDDLLVSGTGTDDMWGDARQLLDGSTGGRDVFRFLADSGDDTIHDFERGKDVIEVDPSLLPPANVATGARLAAFAGLAQSDLGKLTIEEHDADGDGTTDSIIHFDARNSVTVLGVTGLTSDDIVAAPGNSYVLFGRTSAPIGTRDKWVGSEANSQASHTPGSGVRGSAFNADTATAAGAALAGAGFADYAADGILANANVAMFNLTEAPLGGFATGAVGDLETKIASGTPLFGTAKTDLDPTNSDIDLSASKLHLAQTDADWNGIKNIEVSLDSTTSLRDIRLENFVDTRVKIGDATPAPGTPDGAVFDVALLGTKRGEVDASHAPAAIALTLDVWTNVREYQNSFDIKGSVFDDVVTIGPGAVGTTSTPGVHPPWYQPSDTPVSFDPPLFDLEYKGVFTTVSANLGAGDDQYDTFIDFLASGAFFVGEFSVNDRVWGGSGDDALKTGNDDDRLFGDNGSGAWLNRDPLAIGGLPGNDHLDAGAGRDWIEGNGDTGEVVIQLIGGSTRFLDLSTKGDVIDCGTHFVRNPFIPKTDEDRDVVNFNAGDGFDVVHNFGAPIVIRPPIGPFPPEVFDPVHDVLRIENVGALTTEVINSSEGIGTLVQNGAGSVFLVGVTTPLAQSVDGKYLLLFDAT